MSPIRSLKRTSFYTTRFHSALHLFQKSELESISPVNSRPDNILHSRQSSEGNSRQGTGFPFISNAETATPHPGQQHASPSIFGLDRSLFLVVVSGAVILSLVIFIPVCCWRRRRHERKTLPTKEADLESPRLREKPPPVKHIYDAPRPDSTTLPIQGILVRVPERGLPVVHGTRGGSLSDMLNDFNKGNGRVSHHRRFVSEDGGESRLAWDDIEVPMEISAKPPARSGSSNRQDRSRSRSTLGPASPPLAVVRFPAEALCNSNLVRDSRPPRIPPLSSGPRTAIQFPTIASLASNPRPASAVRKGNQPGHPEPALKASPNKLRKKAHPKPNTAPEPRPIASFPAVPIFGELGRASDGSMGSYWANWWESSFGEEEGEGNKRRP